MKLRKIIPSGIIGIIGFLGILFTSMSGFAVSNYSGPASQRDTVLALQVALKIEDQARNYRSSDLSDLLYRISSAVMDTAATYQSKPNDWGSVMVKWQNIIKTQAMLEKQRDILKSILNDQDYKFILNFTSSIKNDGPNYSMSVSDMCNRTMQRHMDAVTKVYYCESNQAQVCLTYQTKGHAVYGSPQWRISGSSNGGKRGGKTEKFWFQEDWPASNLDNILYYIFGKTSRNRIMLTEVPSVMDRLKQVGEYHSSDLSDYVGHTDITFNRDMSGFEIHSKAKVSPFGVVLDHHTYYKCNSR